MSKTMKYLYFDTETNGLPTRRGGSDTDINNHPIIVEMAWQIVDGDKLVKRRTALLKPDPDVVWNNESAAIHKIFKPFALQNGAPVSDILTEFRADAAGCDVLLAHNLAFDLPVLKCSYVRLNATETFDWLPRQQICTMKATTQLCKLPFVNSKYPVRPGEYKQPRLSELHTYLFGSVGEFAFHSAGEDVDCLVKCTQELVRRNLLTLE
jgi:DNA polymerase III epsilon subunit-like protein